MLPSTHLRATLRSLRLAPRLARLVGWVIGLGLLVVSLLDGCSSSQRLGAITAVAPAVASTTSTAPAVPVTPVVPAVGEPVTAAPRPGVSPVVAYAIAQVGKPYRFGAAGPSAFDCSGLTRAAYQVAGIDLPHRSAWQARRGQAVAWRAGGIQPGDLVFTRGGRPRHDLGHVGLAVSATEWVVAPAPGQRVRREPIPFGRIQEVRRLVEA